MPVSVKDAHRRAVRPLLLALMGLILGAVAVAMPASPAAASGGGCQTVVKGSWNVGACSSDNGANITTEYYINAKPTTSSCKTLVRIYDQTTAKFVNNGWTSGCYLGRNGASSWTWRMTSGHKYQGTVSIFVNGSSTAYSSWSSKVTTCC